MKKNILLVFPFMVLGLITQGQRETKNTVSDPVKFATLRSNPVIEAVTSDKNEYVPEAGRDYYLAKSKSQKAAAWGLLGAGIALIGTGFLIGGGNYGDFDQVRFGSILVKAGAASSLISIPFFIASSKNKTRANLSFFRQRRGNMTFTGVNVGIPLGR